MRYRLALDLGSTSLGWAMVRLDAEGKPNAIIKAGVRIFSDGREAYGGASLAVTRRMARAMRRRRDRLLKRKARMMRTLIAHGFFPTSESERKALTKINPYTLRAKGLDAPLTPEEFARALFHINQRRGFKSNRKTDKTDNDSGALKAAIKRLSLSIDPTGAEGKPRTVGEYLHRRDQARQTVRARYREERVASEDGKARINKSYDLYIDRAMVEAEFDVLWAKQASLNPSLFNETARAELKDCLLYQRSLKPVKAGRCTFLPDEERAPLALPSQQRFRIYQEVNNLRVLREGLREESISLEQRERLVDALERHDKRSFTQIKTLLGLDGSITFNLEDEKRQGLDGNKTSVRLSKRGLFGTEWFSFSSEQQDAIVMQLVTEENETRLIRWLQDQTGVNEAQAEVIANTSLPEGYGSLSVKALSRILPELQRHVVTFDKAVQAAGFEHHSRLNAFGAVTGRTFDTEIERINPSTGEIQRLHAFHLLPYYGEFLQRHVGFGTGKAEDPEEKRFGKIANPTVHIGLNQVRVVVNALIKRYGHPAEVIVELARDLKQSQEQRREDQKRQAKNQDRNEKLRTEAARILQVAPERVRQADIQKLILWNELSPDPADRRCPYSGVQISAHMVLSEEVAIEHILPFSRTLDDSLNNKTVAMRQANRIKGNRTPWEARNDFETQGWRYEDILRRAAQMPRHKRYRFGEDGHAQWLKQDKDFLARALNDTRYLSRVAREYLSLICPQSTRVIPGQMTAMLRRTFGLNDILSLNGEKNRDDHRHHAVDACVIAVTDQGMLQRFAQATASAREQQLNRLVADMPFPWPTYREHVSRAVNSIWVSHKPDHGYEGAMHEDTAYRPPHLDRKKMWRTRGIGGQNPNEKAADSKTMIGVAEPISERHCQDAQGGNLPYKGYVGGSNYCLELVRNAKGRWTGEVVSTFEAYQIARIHGANRLRHPSLSQSGQPLVMRLMINDTVKFEEDGRSRVVRVVKIDPSWACPNFCVNGSDFN